MRDEGDEFDDDDVRCLCVADVGLGYRSASRPRSVRTHLPHPLADRPTRLPDRRQSGRDAHRLVQGRSTGRRRRSVRDRQQQPRESVEARLADVPAGYCC